MSDNERALGDVLYALRFRISGQPYAGTVSVNRRDLETLLAQFGASARVSSEGTSDRARQELRQEGFREAARRYSAMKPVAICHEAERTYPLPKITRQRVVVDPISPGVEFQFFNNRLQFRWADNGFSNWDNDVFPRFSAPFAERFAMWADLIANPTELVDLPSSLPALDGRD